jgi:spermidine/putrescine transport system ATP-binding protein
VVVSDRGATTGEVLLMVRPERVVVSRQAPPGGRTGLAVTVEGVIFRGPTVHVTMAAGGTRVVAHLTDERALDGLRPGDAAWACWDTDAGSLVPGPRQDDRVRPPDDHGGAR